MIKVIFVYSCLLHGTRDRKVAGKSRRFIINFHTLTLCLHGIYFQNYDTLQSRLYIDFY